MSKKSRYTFYSDGCNKIIAVSSYAGKVVRGIAKCDPKDTFNQELGESLAQARCAQKIAKRKYKNACKEQARAAKEFRKARARLDKMNAYVADAGTEVVQTTDLLSSIMLECK